MPRLFCISPPNLGNNEVEMHEETVRELIVDELKHVAAGAGVVARMVGGSNVVAGGSNVVGGSNAPALTASDD